MTEHEAINILQLNTPFVASKEANKAVDMAINALEKQIAKKVIVPPCNACENELCDCECEHFGKTFIDDFRCPTCNSEKVCIAEYDIRHDYCPNCGQKLDWSEV